MSRYFVINHEEQFTIWSVERPIPRGWKPIGKTGTKEECIKYIEEVWTDMQPSKLRNVIKSNFIKLGGK